MPMVTFPARGGTLSHPAGGQEIQNFTKICSKHRSPCIDLTNLGQLALRHGITLLLRLEKTFKIIIVQLSASTTIIFTSKLCPQVQHPHVLWNAFRAADSTPTLDSLFQSFPTISVKKCFLISNLNIPWYILNLFPLCYLGEKTNSQCQKMSKFSINKWGETILNSYMQ